MDANELKEEIIHQRELQKEYRKRLRVLENRKRGSVICMFQHIFNLKLISLTRGYNNLSKLSRIIRVQFFARKDGKPGNFGPCKKVSHMFYIYYINMVTISDKC